MIIEFVSSLFAGVLQLAVGILPVSSWNPDASGFDDVIGWVKGLDNNFPVDTAFALLALYVFFAKGMLLFDAAMWVYRHIPFVGGSD